MAMKADPTPSVGLAEAGRFIVDSPQQTMTSLRDLRESLAALVTEFRGLREDQQRMNGLLLERLPTKLFAERLPTKIFAELALVGEAIGKLSLKLDRNWEHQTNLESTTYNRINELAVALAKRKESEGSADGNGKDLPARRKRSKRRK